MNRAIEAYDATPTVDTRVLTLLHAVANLHGVSIVVQVEDVPDDPIVLSKALLRADELEDARIVKALIDRLGAAMDDLDPRPLLAAAADLRL